jgi:hypothetical protein
MSDYIKPVQFMAYAFYSCLVLCQCGTVQFINEVLPCFELFTSGIFPQVRVYAETHLQNGRA